LTFKVEDAAIDENFVIPMEQQKETMIQAGASAVDALLKNMKMVK